VYDACQHPFTSSTACHGRLAGARLSDSQFQLNCSSASARYAQRPLKFLSASAPKLWKRDGDVKSLKRVVEMKRVATAGVKAATSADANRSALHFSLLRYSTQRQTTQVPCRFYLATARSRHLNHRQQQTTLDPRRPPVLVLPQVRPVSITGLPAPSPPPICAKSSSIRPRKIETRPR
jgi:hypothetical protein